MKFLIRRFREACLALVVMLVTMVPSVALAQSGGGTFATRGELEQLLAAQTSGSGSNVSEHQLGSYMNAAAVRHRLEEGDFQPGDQIRIRVENYGDLSDTYVVDPDRNLVLPVIGEIPLRGVLRSELQQHLTESLSRYIRNPVVRAESTIRLVVIGAVGSPGYYSVGPQAQVTDVLQAAGGTARNARLTGMRVERGPGGDRVLAGDQLHQAVITGRTLDQLGIQAGDQLVVPEHQSTAAQVRNVLGWVTTIGGVVWLFTRINRRY